MNLTPAQTRFLSRHASGLTLEEIASENFVSVSTVANSLAIVRALLHANNNVQSALIARKLGYLSDPDENGIVLAQSPYAIA